ncbi:MAG: 50S ribosomal protein L9 [Candidatus Krumholzibacteria bacterium]|nr:50S ribosomal protein L9 [Candidatus Krumholzibacteria bacterium]
MELILREDVEGLGARGDVVQVKPGYARNFLIPCRLAVPANEAQKRILEKETKLREIRDDRTKQNLQLVAEKLKDSSCTIVVQAGEEDKLYGSVTAHDITEALVGQGFEIDHNQVMLDEPIKVLGIYTVPVRLHKEIEVPIKVWVVKE